MAVSDSLFGLASIKGKQGGGSLFQDTPVRSTWWLVVGIGGLEVFRAGVPFPSRRTRASNPNPISPTEGS